MSDTSSMLIIDGSQGEGGGQILRSSLALSLLTGTPFRMVNIRAGRAKPGLMRQHLTCVLAAAEVGNADVRGAAVGSRQIEFHPGAVTPRHFRFAIGTAGSTTLVVQTVLPVLMLAGGPSTLTVEGGTHNIHAPTFDYLGRVFLPVINRMGPRVSARLERHGFYPAGGGRIVVDIEPAPSLRPLELLERGEVTARAATSLIAQLPGHIAERELEVVRARLGWSPDLTHIRGTKESHSPGNALMIEVASEHLTEMFTAIGQTGKPAEDVAAEACSEAAHYLASAAPVGPHLADQLILPFALAGAGAFVATAMTLHTRTNIETVQRFLPVGIEAGEERDGGVRIAFGAS